MIGTEKIKIKVCGMRDSKNITQVAALRPDYMGFIFYAPSPRYVGPDFRLPEKAEAPIKRVGVFVNASNEEILKQSRVIGFDHVQLHGNESLQQAGKLKELGFTLIKVFSVDDDFDFAKTKPYVPVVDYFLFDTKGKLYGGNARAFNWKVLSRYDQAVPFFLSGGISPENVDEISTLKDMNLHALDVNSGVEAGPALKDINKLEVIFKAIENLPLKGTTS